MQLWENGPNRQKAITDIDLYMKEIAEWKYDAMEIRCELILTREKLAKLYIATGNEGILSIMGDLFRVIEQIKGLA